MRCALLLKQSGTLLADSGAMFGGGCLLGDGCCCCGLNWSGVFIGSGFRGHLILGGWRFRSGFRGAGVLGDRFGDWGFIITIIGESLGYGRGDGRRGAVFVAGTVFGAGRRGVGVFAVGTVRVWRAVGFHLDHVLYVTKST